MAERFCTRCGKPCVEQTTDTERVWNCPSHHGVVHREPLPAAVETAIPARTPKAAGKREGKKKRKSEETKK